MELLLGFDFGTSYFKVGLFDRSGALLGLARLKVATSSPHEGWIELSIDDFWELLRKGVGMSLKDANARPADIVGISYSSQANTFVLLDEENQPLTPLILWTDARATLEPELAEFALTKEFGEATGFNGIGPLWAAAKMRWFQQEQPAVWRRTRQIKTLSDYFTFALSGQHAGDAGTAAFLGLYELRRRNWWPVALQRFELDDVRLSQPLLPGTHLGTTASSAVKFSGLPSGIPFAVGGLDHQVASLGSGVGSIADASISTGTVLAALRLVTQPEPELGCYHGPHFGVGEYYRLAFNSNGARQLESLQQKLCPAAAIGDMIAKALAEDPSTSGKQFLDQNAGATIRTALTNIAQSHRELLCKIDPAQTIRTLVATGGGARSLPWLKLKADLFNLPIVVPECGERACLGAAIIAAKAASLWPDLHTATRSMITPHCVIYPGS
jgi:xylulokinase